MALTDTALPSRAPQPPCQLQQAQRVYTFPQPPAPRHLRLQACRCSGCPPCLRQRWASHCSRHLASGRPRVLAVPTAGRERRRSLRSRQTRQGVSLAGVAAWPGMHKRSRRQPEGRAATQWQAMSSCLAPQLELPAAALARLQPAARCRAATAAWVSWGWRGMRVDSSRMGSRQRTRRRLCWMS